MLYDAFIFRDKDERDKITTEDSYMKWWAERPEFDFILERLDVNYDDVKDELDRIDDLHCIFLGKPRKKTIAGYLDFQFNTKQTSFRRTISSVVSDSQFDAKKTDEFLDKLKIEIIPFESQDSETIYKELLSKKLYVLNSTPNFHPLAKDIIKNLNKLKRGENPPKRVKANPPGPITFEVDTKRNLIYFGAPGTGKSYNLNKDKDVLLKDFPKNYERVTFHPDYSYANFVGTYKPVPEGESITYEYVPGPFMRILKKAIGAPDEPFLLIIEEINRANVAAVFGDVFQILDRNKNNESVYPIDASEDMKSYLNLDKIRLPKNLFIWATMNSADQGVFPMDTAFKRRWDFKYFSINHDEDLIDDTHVIIDGETIYWNDLRKQINDELLSYKVNEDKLMGPFFAFNEFMNQEIPTETFKDIFKNKIIMYLFEDAAKPRRNELFSGAKTKDYVTYSQICEMFDVKGLEIFCDNIKNRFLDENEE